MCFICRILNGAENLTAGQAHALKPVAAAVFNASCEAVHLDPAAIEGLRMLAIHRQAPDALEVGRLINTIEELRERARAYYERFGGNHLTRTEVNPENVSKEELDVLRELERVAILAGKNAGTVTCSDTAPGYQMEQAHQWLSGIAGEPYGKPLEPEPLPLDCFGLSTDEKARILALDAELSNLAHRLWSVSEADLLKLTNAHRSPSAIKVLRILGEARKQILS